MTAPIGRRQFLQVERKNVLERLLMDARRLKRTQHGPFIVPAERRRPWSPLHFVKELPRVAEVTVGARYGIKGVLILNGRLLRTSNRLRLREIGMELGVTREWVRVVERQILGMFAHIFFVDHYVTAKFRIREEFTIPLRNLEQKIRIFRYGNFTFSDWARCLQRSWCLHPRELGSVEPFVVGMLNYPISEDRPLSNVPSLRSIDTATRPAAQ